MRNILLSVFFIILLSACSTNSSNNPPAKIFLGPDVLNQEMEAARKEMEDFSVEKIDAAAIVTPEQEELLRTTFDALVNSGTDICAEVSTSPAHCDWMSLTIKESLLVNAYAWGYRGLNINSGLLVYVGNEHEMAYLLAHEMGHQVAYHVTENSDLASANTKAGVFFLRTLVCGLSCAGTLPSVGGEQKQAVLAEMSNNNFNETQEREADYIAGYLMDRADFDVLKGRLFLAKMAKIKPLFGEKGKEKAGYFDTHSFSTAKLARLSLTMKEIQKKKSTGKPVMPEGVVEGAHKDSYY